MAQPPLGGLWAADFPLDMQLDMEPASVLDADLLAQWLGAEPLPPLDVAPAPPLELTTSGGNSSGTSTGKSLSKEEERLERARAQNRAKQTRFRQRQKERKEQMAAQFEATAADLEREQQLNTTMKHSCAALEAVKCQKDIAVQVLEAAAADDRPAKLEQGEQQLKVVAGAASGFNLKDHLWSLPFLERVELCEGLCRATAPAQQTIKQGAESRYGDGLPDGFGLCMETKKQLAMQMAAHNPELLEAALSISSETLIKEWGELGDLAAQVIGEYDAGTIDEAGVEERMCSAVMYFAILGAALLSHKPETLQHLMQHSSLPGETEEQKAARWRGVAVAMGVTREQCAGLVGPWQTYCERMDQLTADTAVSLQTMKEVEQNLSAQLLESGLSNVVQNYVKVFEAAGQLKHQTNAALLITFEFMSVAGSKVTPLQKTRMMAMCRPLHPDVVSIVREGLDEHGLLPQRPPPTQ